MSVSGSEGVACHAYDVSYVALWQELVSVAIGVPQINPAAVFRYEKGGAEAFDFTHVVGRESLVAVPCLVIEVYPAALGFHAGNGFHLFLRYVRF